MKNVRDTNRAKYWLFTSFQEFIYVSQHDDVSYFITQLERCPDTGRIHWQGYLELKIKSRYSKVQQIIEDPGANCRQRKGTAAKNKQYCSKDDSAVQPIVRFEYGNIGDAKGAGGAFNAIVRDACQAPTLNDAYRIINNAEPGTLAKNFTNVRNYLTFEYREPDAEPYVFKPKFQWILPQAITDWVAMEFTKKWDEFERPRFLLLTGDTEVGKTSWARSLGQHMFWRGCVSFSEWDKNAKYIVIDDIDWKFIPYKKQLLTSMGMITVTDKYLKKKTVMHDKPVIVLTNHRDFMEYERESDRDFYSKRCVQVDLYSPLFSKTQLALNM